MVFFVGFYCFCGFWVCVCIFFFGFGILFVNFFGVCYFLFFLFFFFWVSFFLALVFLQFFAWVRIRCLRAPASWMEFQGLVFYLRLSVVSGCCLLVFFVVWVVGLGFSVVVELVGSFFPHQMSQLCLSGPWHYFFPWDGVSL